MHVLEIIATEIIYNLDEVCSESDFNGLHCVKALKPPQQATPPDICQVPNDITPHLDNQINYDEHIMPSYPIVLIIINIDLLIIYGMIKA